MLLFPFLFSVITRLTAMFYIIIISLSFLSQDKTVKSTVYRITGSIPAGNFIQLPKTNTQSLGLTGRYFYLLFRPIPSKHFVVHLDVATADNLVIRVSFSNLFKSFKSTSTWLQFPFVCGTPQGPLPPYASDIVKGNYLT